MATGTGSSMRIVSPLAGAAAATSTTAAASDDEAEALADAAVAAPDVCVAGVSVAGVEVDRGSAEAVPKGGVAGLRGAVIHCHDDHRIAMSFG